MSGRAGSLSVEGQSADEGDERKTQDRESLTVLFLGLPKCVPRESCATCQARGSEIDTNGWMT